ncbi:VOC family protein [Cellulosispirillum alkaliphilum]|uniref:VOC family protein n=1 Tax=Cellulosispirillum alkaliphilum TaxID=3039283 RepID=UPI003D6FD8CD
MIKNITTLHNTPPGDTDTVTFELFGYEFMAISPGNLFKLNPSISFFINFVPLHDKDARARLVSLWNKLSEGGTVLMPRDKYPFIERYGWLEDKYGVSCQLILADSTG